MQDGATGPQQTLAQVRAKVAWPGDCLTYVVMSMQQSNGQWASANLGADGLRERHDPAQDDQSRTTSSGYGPLIGPLASGPPEDSSFPSANETRACPHR